MSHSHSQIIALPIVPPAISTRLAAMKEYFEQTGNCVLCEKPPKELLIHESRHFISVVPFAASYAFEIWIIPRYHSAHFHDIDKEKVKIVAPLPLELINVDFHSVVNVFFNQEKS